MGRLPQVTLSRCARRGSTLAFRAGMTRNNAREDSRRERRPMDRTLPTPTPETAHFWEGCKAGELRLQRCAACAEAYFPPRPFCPACGSRVDAAFRRSCQAILWGYVINP